MKRRMYVCTCMYVCIHRSTAVEMGHHGQRCTLVCVSMCVWVCIYICTQAEETGPGHHVQRYVCVCVCVHVCVHVCVNVCVCVCVCDTHTHTPKHIHTGRRCGARAPRRAIGELLILGLGVTQTSRGDCVGLMGSCFFCFCFNWFGSWCQANVTWRLRRAHVLLIFFVCFFYWICVLASGTKSRGDWLGVMAPVLFLFFTVFLFTWREGKICPITMAVSDQS